MFIDLLKPTHMLLGTIVNHSAVDVKVSKVHVVLHEETISQLKSRVRGGNAYTLVHTVTYTSGMELVPVGTSGRTLCISPSPRGGRLAVPCESLNLLMDAAHRGGQVVVLGAGASLDEEIAACPLPAAAFDRAMGDLRSIADFTTMRNFLRRCSQRSLLIAVLFEGLWRMSVSAEEFARRECEGMLSI
jgi:hypothetical protein